MFGIDQTRKKLADAININQGALNQEASRYQRMKVFDNIRRQPIQQNDQNRQRERQNARIQRNQIQLKNMREASSLLRGRIEDEENLIDWGERFPYGKDNVDRSNDVLERYKANYSEASFMLDKFRKEAEKLKKTSQKRRKNIRILQKNQQQSYQPRKGGQITRFNEHGYKTPRKKKLKKKIKASEEQKMCKISQTLKVLAAKLQHNALILRSGIDYVEKRWEIQRKNKLFSMNALNCPLYDSIDEIKNSQKEPVVIYGQKKQNCDKKTSFSENKYKMKYNYQETVKKIQSNSHHLKRLEYYWEKKVPLFREHRWASLQVR